MACPVDGLAWSEGVPVGPLGVVSAAERPVAHVFKE